MEHEWEDLYPEQEVKYYSFQIQWCKRTKNVRARRTSDEEWQYDYGKSSKHFAESVGERLIMECYYVIY